MDAHELVLHGRVVDALEDALCSTNEIYGFEIEVDRETVTIRGRAKRPSTIECVERTVRAVAGVEGVINRLVVGT